MYNLIENLSPPGMTPPVSFKWNFLFGFWTMVPTNADSSLGINSVAPIFKDLGGSEIHSVGIASPEIISESDDSISEFEQNLRFFFRIYMRDRRQ